MNPVHEGTSNDVNDNQCWSITVRIPENHISYVVLHIPCYWYYYCVKFVCFLHISSLLSVCYVLFQLRSVHCVHIFSNIMLLHASTSVYISLYLCHLLNILSVEPPRRADTTIEFPELMLLLSCRSHMDCVCSVAEKNVNKFSKIREEAHQESSCRYVFPSQPEQSEDRVVIFPLVALILLTNLEALRVILL